MKYFTKEELEDITKELIERPTRETLKKLNEKYNGKSEVLSQTSEEPAEIDMPASEVVPTVVQPLINNEVVSEEKSPRVAVEPSSGLPIAGVVEQPVPNPTTNLGTQNLETPKVESSPLDNNVPASSEIPGFELPKLDSPTTNFQNNAPINFTGNLFDTQPPMANLMQTTDNFNLVPNTMPTTEVPVTGTPFFGPHISVENNPIPVGGPVNNTPVQSPTMFGQLEQNYM